MVMLSLKTGQGSPGGDRCQVETGARWGGPVAGQSYWMTFLQCLSH